MYSTTYAILFLVGLCRVLVGAQPLDVLAPREYKDWTNFKDINPWSLPEHYVKGTGDKAGSVYLGHERIRCGVVAFDGSTGIWMIPANNNFETVGYILPRGGYDIEKDKDMGDCVLREALEEGGLVISRSSLKPLGLSKGGSVFWFKGTVTKTVTPTEVRAHPPKLFSLTNAPKELQKPLKSPQKKEDMRMAFSVAERL
ncbi:NUDIX domain-containing protein [Colletotrichum graminicola]|uniref:NUDIX domain-containing protein n=1 Tax=Colletotrichum graminicola (strain M1.001 / M2 / FGSC 10212) TaxID=645133 RepID=E3R169_COLGM|nr:NUDIX domain-containing protein [Colletotrichum graminicola M1.001]EFQ36857.1 NUDIX domain-containing protein [Colletotrichum graminicola M1.001]WDK12978.1 NUDIX domain-containing protein [Colletotrichum graminicola]